MAKGLSIGTTGAEARRRMLLSTTWIFVSLNYIFCDVLSLMESGFLKDLMAGGESSGLSITQPFLLASALLMELPFSMVLLSRALPLGAARWANVCVGLAMAAVQVLSFGMGSAPTLHYFFFSVVEVAADLFIAAYAWKLLSRRALGEGERAK
jgi:hypothetical protein